MNHGCKNCGENRLSWKSLNTTMARTRCIRSAALSLGAVALWTSCLLYAPLFVVSTPRKHEWNERTVSLRAAAPSGVAVAEPESEQEEWQLPPDEHRPGSLDQSSFKEGPSVKLWKELDPARQDNFHDVDFAADAAYWLYHIGRTGFFACQGLASVAVANAMLGSREIGKNSAGVTPDFLKNFFSSPQTFATLTVTQSMKVFQQDLGYIKEGLYKKPYDMSPRHRQWSPSYVADKGYRYIREAVSVLRRNAQGADASPWMESSTDIYPPYYRHAFHYQTDGWLSTESAEVYETSTETLFLGRQDAMQRTTLVHIARYLQESGLKADNARLLEIACGTGRVHTFIRDSWPAMQTTASDLSPYYLEEARKNNAYWESEFAPKGLGSTSFVQANAESLPFEENAFDIVVSVYLFHELPADAQDNVFADVSRVLKGGGLFVLTDSVQLGDRPRIDGQIGRFGNFAEPHYQAYIRRDLASLARTHGLEPVAKELSSSTKSLCFRKKT